MSSLLWLAAAAAASPLSITAERAIESARAVYSVIEEPAPPCPESAPGEIVVCADIIDPATQKMPSPTDEGSTEDLIPRAPYLGPPPCVPNLLTFCGRVGGKPRDPMIIDLEAIPEAPPGSDADRIARGEIPAP